MLLLGRAKNSLAQGLGKPGNIQTGGLIDNTPLFGGWLRIVVGPVTALTDVVLTHGLRVVPRFIEIKGAWTGTPPGVSPPAAFAGLGAWTPSQITVRFVVSVTAGVHVAVLIY